MVLFKIMYIGTKTIFQSAKNWLLNIKKMTDNLPMIILQIFVCWKGSLPFFPLRL